MQSLIITITDYLNFFYLFISLKISMNFHPPLSEGTAKVVIFSNMQNFCERFFQMHRNDSGSRSATELKTSTLSRLPNITFIGLPDLVSY